MTKNVEVRIAGFDCAEEGHQVVLLDANGKVEREMEIINRRDFVEEGLAELLLILPEGARLAVVVESRRSHGKIVSEVADQLGCEVWVVNSVALNHYRPVEGQPHKTDRWDAFLAARMAFDEKLGCRLVAEKTQEERVFTRLTRFHGQITKTRTQHVARLRANLLELAPEILHSSWKGPKPNSKAIVYLLGRWPAFEGMERARLGTIEKILHKCCYGSKAPGIAKSLRDMAQRIGIVGAERAAIAMEINHLIEQIATCDRLLHDLQIQIREGVEAHEIGLKLIEMPGIGVITTGVTIGELLPVARLADEGQSATYAGLTPLSRQTGKGKNKRRIAKGINKRVLRAHYNSAVASISCSAIDRAYFEKKVRDYSGHPKPTVAAFIALARKRHQVIYRLMTTKESYDKEKLITSHLERLEMDRADAA